MRIISGRLGFTLLIMGILLSDFVICLAQDKVFTEKEVVIGKGKFAVHGTLSIPLNGKSFPGVVLVHGSGPQDRDETIGPNKPFQDLAWGLARRGIAVLRYEKRTKEHTAEMLSMNDRVTVREETIDDVIAAVDLLRNIKEVDTKRIFVLGHSLGGMLIPRIGTLDSSVAGFIILAGTSRPLEDVILEQMSYFISLTEAAPETRKKQLDQLKEQVKRVKDPKLSLSTPSAGLPFGVPAAYWLDLRGYNPPEVAKNLKQPILILQGGRDYQVTMEDFEGWERALSLRKNVEFKVYPALNHLFIEGKGKGTPAEYEIPGHVAEVVIDDVAWWIKKY